MPFASSFAHCCRVLAVYTPSFAQEVFPPPNGEDFFENCMKTEILVVGDGEPRSSRRKESGKCQHRVLECPVSSRRQWRRPANLLEAAFVPFL